MNLEIQYLKKADKFFSKNSHTLSKEKLNYFTNPAIPSRPPTSSPTSLSL